MSLWKPQWVRGYLSLPLTHRVGDPGMAKSGDPACHCELWTSDRKKQGSLKFIQEASPNASSRTHVPGGGQERGGSSKGARSVLPSGSCSMTLAATLAAEPACVSASLQGLQASLKTSEFLHTLPKNFPLLKSRKVSFQCLQQRSLTDTWRVSLELSIVSTTPVCFVQYVFIFDKKKNTWSWWECTQSSTHLFV